MTSYPTPEDLQGAVRGTLLYLALYLFCFIPFQSFSKFFLLAQKKKQQNKKNEDGETVSWRAVKYYNSRDRVALVGDRTVGNFVEFAILFLPLYWIHAILVDPSESWTIALVYTVARSFYPFLFYYQPYYIFLSTAPGYVVLAYLMLQIAIKYAFA